MNTKNCLSSVYRIPAIGIDVKMVLTNAAPLGPYRGAGRPEAIYLIERLIDGAARQHGDRPRVAAPAQFHSAEGDAVPDAERPDLRLRRVRSRDGQGARARRLEGLCQAPRRIDARTASCAASACAASSRSRAAFSNEKADLRFEDGKAAIRLGVQAMGQGHLSTLPRIVAKQLGIDVADVKLIEGDSDEVPDGTPSVASRSLMMAGSASAIACDTAIEKGRRIASQIFEVAAGDIEFSGGVYRVAGTDLKMPILELAQRARSVPNLPDDLKNGLDTLGEFVSPQMSFPNGCHVCEVEIDPETGVVAVVGYVAVDDVGNIIHEMIVDGQTHGGIAQGLGQVLGEQVVYGADGQLINASFMDYVMPRATDIPPLTTGAPQRALHHQSARREGRGRVRRRGLAAVGDERDHRRAVDARDRASRPAGLAAAGLAGAAHGGLRTDR